MTARDRPLAQASSMNPRASGRWKRASRPRDTAQPPASGHSACSSPTPNRYFQTSCLGEGWFFGFFTFVGFFFLTEAIPKQGKSVSGGHGL